MVCKVSVVVPVYNSGPRVNRCVASLDRQSLRPDEFEVIFVDDGSTDDTPDRLRRIASLRPNVRVEAIPNSGWPSRPRNVGTDLARGAYVLYMDHDDELGDEALERLHAFATAQSSDVVVAKEVAVGRRSLDADMFRQNLPKARVVDDKLLQLLTVHRLFRTEFLRAEKIRFRERVGLLEDHVFAVEAYLKAGVVSVLADYPSYRWITHSDRSNNSSRLPSIDGYFANIGDSIDVVEAYTEPGRERDEMYLRWLRDTLAANCGPRLVRRPEDYRQRWLAHARELVESRFSERLDLQLPPMHRARVRLLRSGDVHGLEALAHASANTTSRPDLVAHEWRDGVLHLHARTVMVDGSDKPVAFERVGGRVMRVWSLDHPVAAPGGLMDVTEVLATARVELKAHNRDSAVEWYLPGTSQVEVIEQDGQLVLVGDVRSVVDPHTAALGHPLEAGVWDFVVRLTALGHDSNRRLMAPKARAAAALVSDTPLVVYRTKNGALSLDVGQRVRTIVGTAGVTPAGAHVAHTADGTHLRVDLPRVHVHGRTELTGHLRLDSAVLEGHVDLPARMVADTYGARLEFYLTALAGEYPLRAEFLGRTTQPFLRLQVADGGSVSLTAVVPESTTAAATNTLQPSRRESDRPAAKRWKAKPPSWLRRVIRRIPGARTVARRTRRVRRVR
jgi:glycosyltransferase involved in cell wall biosynthesis